jgi:hypothetical protein
MNKTKNELAWEKIFNKYQILNRIHNNGHFEISANQINEFRESRLMTKFDHKSQLPKLFGDNKLSILPISRGSYVIGEFETFYSFNTVDCDISTIQFPSFLESLNHRTISSEAIAINCAFISQILNDFTNENILFPTVSGRMSSSSFKFQINASKGKYHVNVENAQVEIDGGYEGDNSLSIIEAKNYISDDFQVRQLYYPFRLWSGKIKKQVRPIFLTYSNGVFYLREYQFTDIFHYNSIALVKHKKYVIREKGLNIENLVEIIDSTRNVCEPQIPFPQANSFERVINLCELLHQKEFLSKEEITNNYDFDLRQTDYYINAGRYLGIIESCKAPLTGYSGCVLSKKGRKIFSLGLMERQIQFVKLIVSHKVFRETLKLHLENNERPQKETVVEIMHQSGLFQVDSSSTYMRRASTVIGWVNWIINQLEENVGD